MLAIKLPMMARTDDDIESDLTYPHAYLRDSLFLSLERDKLVSLLSRLPLTVRARMMWAIINHSCLCCLWKNRVWEDLLKRKKAELFRSRWHARQPCSVRGLKRSQRFQTTTMMTRRGGENEDGV